MPQPNLDEWIAVASGIRDFYQSSDGLKRVPGDFSMPELANWLYHWREEEHSLEWIRQAIRDDAAGEWRQKHPGEAPNVPLTPPVPPPIVDPGPLPSSGRLYPVTDESDGIIKPRMYNYWANAWIGEHDYFVFCGTSNGPRFFAVDKQTGVVTRLGQKVKYGGETEGWYFNAEGQVYLIDGPRLLLVDALNGGAERVVMDISSSHPGCDLWQAHSSTDGRAHSATVRRIVPDGPYQAIGTVVFLDGVEIFYEAADGYNLDESQITTDRRYLLIKTSPDDDNIVINLETGERRFISKAEGALGHSDCGDSLAVGADRANGTCALMDYRKPLAPGAPLFNSWNIGHVALRNLTCIVSNETIIGRVAMDGSGVTPLLEHGMVVPPGVSDPYDWQVKANLDPSARVACFMSNRGTDRQDVYLLVL